VSSGATGCTSSNQPYTIWTGDDTSYTFWDTPGLNEGDLGTVPSEVAVQKLLELVTEHSVHLLVYCVRGRLVDITRVNYDVFWGIICRKKVPIVLVVTGLEGNPDWWRDNRNMIKKMKMSFWGYACVTSWKGKNNIYAAMYQESARRVWKLVQDHCQPNPWRMTPEALAETQRKIEEHKNGFYNVGSESGMMRFLKLIFPFLKLGQ
jgi:hypothetical protein